MGIVNLTSLTRANETYQPTLRQLPAFLLEPFVSKFHLNLLEVDTKDVILHMRRRGAMMKPYGSSGTGTASDSEAFKLIESALTVDKCFIALKDYIGNYTDKRVLAAAGNKVDNKSKTHPLEKQILENVVKTFIEDFVVCSFHAERDSEGTSPIDAFDGFYTKLGDLITAGEVSTAKGNLIETGAFTAPSSGTDITELTQLIAFFRSLDPFLKNNQVDWIVPEIIVQYCRDALGNKNSGFKNVTNQDLVEYIKNNADMAYVPNLITHPVLGTGQRMIVCEPGLLSVGMNSKTDAQFVQVRAPYEDPNLIQFWIQGDFGTRIDDWDKKKFACNDQASVANVALMGDYSVSS
jgi:hypothetical protein